MTQSTSETRLASLTVLFLQAESAAGSDVLTGYQLAPARGKEAQVCDVFHLADSSKCCLCFDSFAVSRGNFRRTAGFLKTWAVGDLCFLPRRNIRS